MTNDSNRGRAFSYWEASYGIGTIVGPMLGGMLVDPAKQYPSVFGNFKLFIRYPYLLPCLVSSLFSLIGVILGLIFMDESLKIRPAVARIPSNDNWDFEGLLRIDCQDLDQCIHSDPRCSIATVLQSNENKEVTSRQQSNMSLGCILEDACACKFHLEPPHIQNNTEDPILDAVRSSVATVADVSSEILPFDCKSKRNELYEDNVDIEPDTRPLLSTETSQASMILPLSDILSRRVCMSILSYASWCLVNIMYEEIYTLFVSTPIKSGGLGFTSFEIGFALSLTGFVQLFAQLVCFPPLEAWLGNVKLFKYASIGMIFFAGLLPFVSDFGRYISIDGIYNDVQKSYVFWMLVFALSCKTVVSVLGIQRYNNQALSPL